MHTVITVIIRVLNNIQREGDKEGRGGEGEKREGERDTDRERERERVNFTNCENFMDENAGNHSGAPSTDLILMGTVQNLRPIATKHTIKPLNNQPT